MRRRRVHDAVDRRLSERARVLVRQLGGRRRRLPHARALVLDRHRENGRHFDATLAAVDGLSLLRRQPGEDSAYWVYALRAARREALIAQLHAHGIGAQRLHLRNDRYRCFSPAPWPLPGADAFDADNLALPCGWWVGAAERERILACVKPGW